MQENWCELLVQAGECSDLSVPEYIHTSYCMNDDILPVRGSTVSKAHASAQVKLLELLSSASGSN